MSQSSKKAILIVEDDPIIAHDLQLTLVKSGYSMAARNCHNASKAIDALAKYDVDLAILDIHLGKGDTGIDVGKVIHNKYDIPYIFLTSFSDEATLAAAQEQGPYGYLVKPFQEATLLTTISLALSNHKKSQKGLDFSTVKQPLTEQEKTLCKGLFEGLSYKEIAEKMFISINTVRYHVKNLYLKFDVNSRAELIASLLN